MRCKIIESKFIYICICINSAKNNSKSTTKRTTTKRQISVNFCKFALITSQLRKSVKFIYPIAKDTITITPQVLKYLGRHCSQDISEQ